jgi:uncharacterized protein YjbK
MSPDQQESEIKVILTDEDVTRLRARLGSPRRTLRQISHFFETPQDHLAKAKMSLRVREECDLASGDEQILLTVKGMGVRAGALMVRPEIESQLDPKDWSGLRDKNMHFADIDLPPVKKLSDTLGDLRSLSIDCMGHIENEREVFDFSADDLDLELLLDRTSYPDGTAEFELESELAQSMAGHAARALRALFGEIGVEWRPSAVGKYVRFRRKIDRDPDAARAEG